MFEDISMDTRRKAMRDALKQIPLHQLPVILKDCGLTEDEQKSVLDHCDGADLIWISNRIIASDRTVDRIRASALAKLCREMEQ